jgi:hypothetical protein
MIALVRRMLIVDEDRRPDFLMLNREVNRDPQPEPPAEVQAIQEAVNEDSSMMTIGVCTYCRCFEEVFQICHPICLTCLQDTVTKQVIEASGPILCRCGAPFQKSLLALVLDGTQYQG